MNQEQLPFGGYRGLEAACNVSGCALIGIVGLDALIFNDNSDAKNTLGLLASFAFFGVARLISYKDIDDRQL